MPDAPPRPIVVINTAHSGSRVLGRMLQAAGVHIGNNLPETMDALDLVPFVKHSLMRAYGSLPDAGQAEAPDSLVLARDAFARHLQGIAAGRRWGWKLCETLLVVPVIDRLFPDAIFVHLVRDGRDVALSDFMPPLHPYWRKVYFGSDRIRRWRGFPLTYRAYRSYFHLFNAARWRYHADVARSFQAMLGARYVEIRYEDIVLRHEETCLSLARALDLQSLKPGLCGPLSTGSIGKWRAEPPRKLAGMLEILEPTLSAFGYSDGVARGRPEYASLRDRFLLGAAN